MNNGSERQNEPEHNPSETDQPPPPNRTDDNQGPSPFHTSAIVGILIGGAAGVTNQFDSLMILIFLAAIAAMLWGFVTKRNERATHRQRMYADHAMKIGAIAIISTNGTYLVALLLKPYFG